MERHFGTSFSNVRIHTDAEAASSAGSINAAAYAIGNNVVFNHGYYRPESRLGRGLLAHELTHVLQQARGAGSSEPIGVAHEHEADRAAQTLDSPVGHFEVRGQSGVGISPLTFAELQKKVWAHVPESAKPYVRPLAQEVKTQVEKVIAPDAEIPAPIVAAIEHPIESAKRATGTLAVKAKEKLRDRAMETAGALKGVVLEGTSIVDTLVWAGYATGKNYGLVNRKTEAPTISDWAAGGIDKAAEAGEKRLFGDLPPEQALVFNSYETGELEGAIGSQVALGFIGVEEVQLALKAVGVLGSARGLILLLEKQGVGGWYKNPEFIGALVGVALSFLSLKSTKASKKIVNIVVNTALASGNLISAGPAVWKLYNDWKQIPEGDPNREKTLKSDLGALVKLVANIVVDIIRHKVTKPGAGARAPTQADSDGQGGPGAKTTPSVPAAAGSPHTAPAVVKPVAEASGATPTPVSAVPTLPPGAKPVAPGDAGLTKLGIHPQPGTRNESKAQWRARDSADRRAKRIDEAIARADADSKRSPTDATEPKAPLGSPEKLDPVARAEHPAAVKPVEKSATGVDKAQAKAVKPTANGHEVVVTRNGVGVCSPPPCPVIHLEYKKELDASPELKQWNDRVQGMRELNPEGAAVQAAALVKTLEAHRNNAARAAGVPRDAVDDAFDTAHSPDVSKKGDRGYLDANAALEFGLHVGEQRKAQIQAGEKNFVLDRALTFDIDEVLPVGAKGIKRQRAVARALDPYNRQLLDPNTNQRTKGLGIDPRELKALRGIRDGVSVVDDPSVLLTRRFSEVHELNGLFERAVASVKQPQKLKPTELKARINKEMRRLITVDASTDAIAVRLALEHLGFEHQANKGFVMMKTPE